MDVELIVGKTYTIKELIEALHISQSTWDHVKEKYLKSLSESYEYEVIFKGRRKYFKIIEKLGDYEKPPNKRSSTKRDSVYQEEIVDVIDCDNLQTAANVSRIIIDRDNIKQFNHTEKTVYKYTWLNMITLFGNGRNIPSGSKGEITERVWCRLDIDNNSYDVMSKEHTEIFLSLFNQEREMDADYIGEVISDYENGLITDGERDQVIGSMHYYSFRAAQIEFKRKYGYRPIKVPLYCLFDRDIINFEDEVA